MARSSLLGIDRAPTQAAGRNTGILGPSDSSDSGSDMQGELSLETSDDFDGMSAAISGAANTSLSSDSDASGTGDRGSALPEHVREAGDISPDRIGRFGEASSESSDIVSLDDRALMEMAELAVEDTSYQEDEDEREEAADPYETPLG